MIIPFSSTNISSKSHISKIAHYNFYNCKRHKKCFSFSYDFDISKLISEPNILFPQQESLSKTLLCPLVRTETCIRINLKMRKTCKCISSWKEPCKKQVLQSHINKNKNKGKRTGNLWRKQWNNYPDWTPGRSVKFSYNSTLNFS